MRALPITRTGRGPQRATCSNTGANRPGIEDIRVLLCTLLPLVHSHTVKRITQSDLRPCTVVQPDDFLHEGHDLDRAVDMLFKSRFFDVHSDRMVNLMMDLMETVSLIFPRPLLG